MTPEQRKQRPLYEGVLKYFPNALMEVAHASWVGNNQHGNGDKLQWTREKSSDHMDACLRHIMDYANGTIKDTDGCYHLAKAIWRLNAELELLIEGENLTKG